jgi:hydrogenase 3 maturation protease
LDAIYAFLKDRFMDARKLAVLGAGSTLRGDDAAGMRVVEELQADFDLKQYPQLLFCPGETAPENYSGKIRQFCPTHFLVIDAADLSAPPGSIVEIRPEDVGGPTFCSHMLPLRVMIRYLAQETGTDVTLLGIQYKSIEFDTGMTDEVQAAVNELSAILKRVIREIFTEE